MSGNLLDAALANLPDYLGAHIFLSVSALFLGLVISLPLAVAASRSALLRGPLLAAASLIQTIPSLALLALFYPLLLALSAFWEANFGVGFRALGFLPALLALTLYSMLPVLRNTVAGLAGIDTAVKMAARGVGMTPAQTLRLVELPLAAPVIMAGVRTAAVWVIGTATLSTPVGQTSLGNYIFTGLQTENWVFVLVGCAAAGALALVFDRLLALGETGFARRSRWRLAASGIGILLVTSLGLMPLIGRGEARIVVGAKSFSEQFILAALIEDRLHEAGYATERREGLGSTVLFNALAAGEVDVYVDYSGTIWANHMKRTDAPGRQAVIDAMSAWLAKEHGIAFLGALGFENAYALAMRRDRAEALDIRTIADLTRHAHTLRIGGDFEFFGRPEWFALRDAYGLAFAGKEQFQANFMYRAVFSGDVDVISAFSSDGRNAQYDLALLDDPKGALPPYDAVLIAAPARAADVRFLEALRPLIGSIDLAAMQQANLMVDRDVDKRSPEEVADWLAAQTVKKNPHKDLQGIKQN